MDKTIIISGRPVVFRKTAGTMLRYKRQFGRELYPDLVQIYGMLPMLKKYRDDPRKPDEFTEEEKVQLAQVVLGIESEWMYDVAFIMAQQADPSITDELEWLDSFEDLNILSVFIQLMPLIKMEQTIAPKNA